MKKLSTLLFFVYLISFVSIGQKDTITIYKVKYNEMKIPAGWEKYILKSGDSLIEFNGIEYMDTSFRDMLSINPNTKYGKKLIKELQNWNYLKDNEPFQYLDIGLLYVQSYRIIGTLTIRKRKSILIDSVCSYSKTNIDIKDILIILEPFD